MVFIFIFCVSLWQVFSYTADKEIRTDDLCLDVSRLNGPVVMLKCHHMKGNQMFEYDAEVGNRDKDDSRTQFLSFYSLSFEENVDGEAALLVTFFICVTGFSCDFTVCAERGRQCAFAATRWRCVSAFSAAVCFSLSPSLVSQIVRRQMAL